MQKMILNNDILKEINIRDRMWCMAILSSCKDTNQMEDIFVYFNKNREILDKTARELKARK